MLAPPATSCARRAGQQPAGRALPRHWGSRDDAQHYRYPRPKNFPAPDFARQPVHHKSTTCQAPTGLVSPCYWLRTLGQPRAGLFFARQHYTFQTPRHTISLGFPQDLCDGATNSLRAEVQLHRLADGQPDQATARSRAGGELNAVEPRPSARSAQKPWSDQRDDGKLANQSVTPESLSAGTLALIAQAEYRPAAIGPEARFTRSVMWWTTTWRPTCAWRPTRRRRHSLTDLNAHRWLLIANGALTGEANAVDLF